MTMNQNSNTSSADISLGTAILVNINVMIGAGIFINTIPLARIGGALGFVGYVIIGVIMLPLIVSIARLLTIHSSGGFYTFGSQELHPFAGFVSAWSYFTSKLASCMLIIHVAVGLILALIPHRYTVNHYVIDLTILTFFVWANTMNINISTIIQKTFIVLKTIPIATAIIVGFAMANGTNFSSVDCQLQRIPLVLPLVLYAALGFEAACSLSSRIRNAKRNAPLAVLISFGLVITIAALYQLAFYGAVGHLLATLPNYQYAFPALFTTLVTNTTLKTIVISILHSAIACSALGASYSIIFSNTWNLYTLALNKHTYFPSYFTHLNKHDMPMLCIILQGVIAASYLLISKGIQLPLQQISGLGSIIAYSISVISLFNFYRRQPHTPYSSYLLIAGALMSCIILAVCCLGSLWYYSSYALLLFATIVLFGMCMFWTTRLSIHT
jgi:amino acid transporter